MTCKHCGVSIMDDGQGDWKHIGPGGYPGLYRCQADGVEYGHLAEPVGTPCRAESPNPCLGAFR